MEDFHRDDHTQPIEIAISRAPTRRKRTENGVSPFESVTDLMVGTDLIGPNGQRGYIGGVSADGLVIFELQEGYGAERKYTTVEMRPEHFAGWITSGGVTL